MRLISICFILLALAGCSTWKAGTPSEDFYACFPGSAADPDRKRRPAAAPAVKVIRLSDQGELVDRCEWTDALYELKYRKSAPDQPFSKLEQPVMLIMYIHGWKHNAQSEDLASFTAFIENLSNQEAARLPAQRRHVVGFYIGWNGLTTDLPLMRELTFWGRKHAADRISQSAIVTKLIGARGIIRTTSSA